VQVQVQVAGKSGLLSAGNCLSLVPSSVEDALMISYYVVL